MALKVSLVLYALSTKKLAIIMNSSDLIFVSPENVYSYNTENIKINPIEKCVLPDEYQREIVSKIVEKYIDKMCCNLESGDLSIIKRAIYLSELVKEIRQCLSFFEKTKDYTFLSEVFIYSKYINSEDLKSICTNVRVVKARGQLNQQIHSFLKFAIFIFLAFILSGLVFI